MNARWTTITDRTATAVYRAAITVAVCFLAMALFDVFINNEASRLPPYRIAQWDRLYFALVLVIALAGLRWTVRGARGYGKGEP